MTINVILKSGSQVELSEDQGRRVLYAITALAATPIIEEINIERITDTAGKPLWPPARVEQAS